MKKNLITLAAATLIAGMALPAYAGQGYDRDDERHYGHGQNHRQQHEHYGRGHRSDLLPAYAKVIAVRPIVRVVTVTTPRETCWDEKVIRRNGGGQSGAPTVVGGVVGGIIGHEMGSGRDRGLTTVAGAVIGAAIGNDIGRNHAGGRTVVTTREQCRIVHEQHQQEQTEGYWVTYRYNGVKYKTRTEQNPGEFIRVQVAVR